MRISRCLILAIAFLTVGPFGTALWRQSDRHLHPKPVATPAVPMTSNFSVPVLMYHAVDTLDAKEKANRLAADLTVSPALLGQQIDWLQAHGYTFVLAADVSAAVRSGSPLPQRAIALTFDDGYENNYTQLLPILRAHHVPATIFIVANTIGTPGHLTWQQAAQMQKAGIRFGSHCMDHVDLTHLPQPVLDKELTQSRQVIGERLSVPVTDIAYPAGEVDPLVLARDKTAGYLAGWGKSGGPVHKNSPILDLPRIRVSGTTTMAQFESMLERSAP
jgi:peptidoglycan/xylan/chitin deacetylase (PgdA/CDA1 family)